MPKSKQRESDAIAEDFRRQAEVLINRRKHDIEMELHAFETSCEMLKAALPLEIRAMTLRELYELDLSEDEADEEENNVTSSNDPKPPKTQLQSAAKPRPRRSRSASQQRVPTACSTTTASDDG